MRGYFRRDDLTAEVLFDGWYRTGDVGHIAADGTTHLTGRVKYEINRAGIKVQPEELDLLLERHEAVEEACAFGVPDEISGEAVAIAIRGTPGSALNAEILRKWCVPRIHNEAIPARWYFVDTIPKTERGKLNRELLRRSCLESNT
jgi:acyl-CoA synthetase (AMP-forming)/AMP-acid ligase II